MVGQIDKNNPTEFESYGNHLRNLLAPAFNLMNVVTDYKEGKFDEKTFLTLISVLDTNHFKHNQNDLLNFSKLPYMEKFNWRSTNLFKQQND